MPNLIKIAAVVIGILLLPLIAMQFTTEVNWQLNDFVVAALLLMITGLAIDYVLRKLKNNPFKILALYLILISLLLVWAELAVGIFGSPFAGS